MILLTPKQQKKLEQELKEDGVTHHNWGDKVIIKGSKTSKHLDPAKTYEVHRILGTALIKKKEAVLVSDKKADDDDDE